MLDDLVDPVGVPVEGVESQLVCHPEPYQQAARQPQGQAGDVDEGEQLVPEQVAVGNEEVVAEHGSKIIF